MFIGDIPIRNSEARAVQKVAVKLKSIAPAKKLEKDADEIVEYMDADYGSRMYPVSIVRDGKYILIGNDKAIKDAQG